MSMVAERVDLVDFCRRLRAVLQHVDRDTAAALFGEAIALRRELERYRQGTRNRTLEQAARVAALDRELSSLAPGARVMAICARTGYSRAKVYRLRKQVT